MNDTLFDRIIRWIGRNQRNAAVLVLVILGIVFFVIPYVVTQWKSSVEFNEATGAIGDTIGGTTGPLIALIAATLTFFAFWVQYRANEQQRLDLQRERFESKFFEMLRLHKDNVTEMTIDGYDTIKKTKLISQVLISRDITKETSSEEIPKLTIGKKIFVTTYTELVSCHSICALELKNEVIENKERYIIKMAYRLLYHGAGSDFLTKVDNSIPKDSEYINRCRKRLLQARTQHESTLGARNIFKFPDTGERVNMYIKYKPFSGHSSRFGHYYRHLFLLTKLVHQQPEQVITQDEKRDYLRMLRAQLSGHEQLMLYFNYLSDYGKNWESNSFHFFSQYRMIHNLPIELTRFTVSPESEFATQIENIKSQGEEMFEYHE